MKSSSQSKLKVEYIRTQFTTEYEVIGSKSACEDWLKKLQENYHPAGYGTYGQFIDELPNGDWAMHAHRSNSCD